MAVAEVKQKIQQARQQVTQKKSQIEEARKKLQQAQKSIPQQTARSLRSGAMSGMQGKVYRGQIERARQDIAGKKRILSGYEG